MSLSIETEHSPTHVYYPGQSIRGQVNYTITKQRKINQAYILFRGKLSTGYVEKRHAGAGNTHGPRKHATEEIRLFDNRTELFRGPYNVSPQKFSWSFEFTIPEFVDCRRLGKVTPGFVSDGVQALPPSFELSNASFSHDARARVKYKLVARVEVGGMLRDDGEERPITIARLASRLPSAPRMIRHEFETQHWSSRSLRAEKLSAKQELKRLFSEDAALKIPCVAFRGFVHLPRAASMTQRFAIGFSIEHFTMTLNDPQAPTLILSSIRLTLNSKTALFALRSGISMFGDRFTSGSTHGIEHHVQCEPVQLALDGTVTIVNDDVRIADWGPAEKTGLVPDFVTYIIRYLHLMEVQAFVRHKESGHVFQMEVGFRFELLESHPTQLGLDVPDTNSRTHETVVGAEDESISGDSELPSYHDDVRPPEAGTRNAESVQGGPVRDISQI